MKLRELFTESNEPGKWETIKGVKYYIVKNKSGKAKGFSGPTPAAKKYAQTGGKYPWESVSEADPDTLGKMNPQMRDVLSKVHADDEAEVQAKKDAEEKARKDSEKAATLYAIKHPEEVEDYIKKLKNHDWYYNYSDDGRVYREGQKQAEEIARLRKKLDPTGRIYDKHSPFKKEGVDESATAGATSSANVASAVPVAAHTGGKSYTGDPWGGKSGTKAPKVPKAAQKKKKDGTAVNALDMKGANLFGGQGLMKR